MKTTFERLEQEKFAPLTREAQHLIKGGRETGGGQEISGSEQRVQYDENGKAYWQTRVVYKTWTADDIVGDRECYYNIGVSYGDWK